MEQDENSAQSAADVYAEASAALETPDGVSYPQALTCVRQAYRDWLRTDAACTHIDRVLKGEIDPPTVTVSIPTGSRDDDGAQIVMEIDLHDVTRKLARKPDDVPNILASILGPLYAYCDLLYARSLEKLAKHSDFAHKVVSKARAGAVAEQ